MVDGRRKRREQVDDVGSGDKGQPRLGRDKYAGHCVNPKGEWYAEFRR